MIKKKKPITYKDYLSLLKNDEFIIFNILNKNIQYFENIDLIKHFKVHYNYLSFFKKKILNFHTNTSNFI